MPRPHPATIVACLALFVALGGSAYAVEHNGSATVIRACYSKHTGALRLLQTGSCHSSERLLSWNNLNPADFYTTTQSNVRFLPRAGTATNAAKLGDQPSSAYTPASLFGNGVTATQTKADDPSCIIGEIKLMAAPGGATLPADWTIAGGQSLAISSNVPLFSLLGTTYGGTGTTFNLPNLQAVDPKGDGPAAPAYVICTGGIFP